MFGFLLALGLMSSTRRNDRQRDVEYQTRLLAQRNQELLEQIAANTSTGGNSHRISPERMSSYIIRKS